MPSPVHVPSARAAQRKRGFVCAVCGAGKVRRDAWASWDEESQSWELSAVFDAAQCDECGKETTLVEKFGVPTVSALP